MILLRGRRERYSAHHESPTAVGTRLPIGDITPAKLHLPVDRAQEHRGRGSGQVTGP